LKGTGTGRRGPFGVVVVLHVVTTPAFEYNFISIGAL
jgi:hypothetical protein